ncbi:MAG: tetratricopeptide repeat protein [Bryobacteraceae bacterium]
MSTGREWLFRILAAVGIPALFLVLLEAALRIGGYGYDPALFMKQGPVYTANPAFGFRFFPRALARAPYPFAMSVVKPAGAYRIFVLGDSAALGDPDPAFGFTRILHQMLTAHQPGRSFEVVNVAMTAINSHVSLAIARECARRQPDLFLVYMGNNEVVGPFGPGTVFNVFTRSRALIRAALALKATRIGQLLNFRERAADRAAWGGMEMFSANLVPADDTRLKSVAGNFRDNLADICRLGRAAGARVILATVATNLKDCAPFASVHGVRLTEERNAQWELQFRAGQGGEPAEAVRAFERAAAIDPAHAELQFRLAQARLRLGDAEGARKAFLLARDLDALRFRADSAINRAVEEVAARTGSEIIDAERVFSEASPSGISGEELFLEHVHMNFSGNYLLARAAFERITGARTALSERECAERLGFTDFDRYNLESETLERMSRPPFTGQFDIKERRKRLEARLAGLRAADPRAIAGQYAAAAARAPRDWAIAEHHAAFLKASGDAAAAVREYHKVVKLVPGYASGRSDFCLALAAAGQLEEAEPECSQAVTLEPHAAEWRYNLGNVRFQRGNLEGAASEYRAALALQPNLPRAHYNLGLLFSQQGRPADAIAEFREAVRLDPRDVHARNNLGVALAGQGGLEEAAEQYREALRIEPRFTQAQRNLDIVLERLASARGR